MKKLSLVIIAIGLFCSFATFAQTKVEATQAVNQVLDGLHEAASKADLDAYLSSFTDTGVFMGTDDWERWSRPESLDKYVAERFAGGTGWTYSAVERNVNFSTEHDIAWFDEITVSKKWGRFRGTGVLINDKGNWKIAHYAMSVLVPNEAWEKVSEINIKAFAQRGEK
ncbi:nuclear transport factor 2 family protein [Paraglaciecola sp. 20A4]|uniref:nuclear transport factor 2 family protein n=1 Tax=Paraglaciecola sp. 20A4 TaxID=2687288 RepID=UPI00140758F1|nr:nuclear transport factor 2 family protein [Paraglaciecola sp. 20A4]